MLPPGGKHRDDTLVPAASGAGEVAAAEHVPAFAADDGIGDDRADHGDDNADHDL